MLVLGAEYRFWFGRLVRQPVRVLLGPVEKLRIRRFVSGPLVLSPFLSLICLSSCVSRPPITDYTLARSAYEAAKESGAARLAPSVWYKADQAYRRGQKFFSEQSYGAARDAFEEARFLCEKAENTARLTSPDGGGLQ